MKDTVSKRIYKAVLDVLSRGCLGHDELVEKTISLLYGGSVQGSQVGKFTEIRGYIGSVIREMKDDGLISSNGEKYCLLTSVPMAVKLRDCENEILSFLSKSAKTKQDIRSHLVSYYGTDKTASKVDDKMLFDRMGQILRRLIEDGRISLVGTLYSLTEETRAKIDDIGSMLELKNAFISRMHRRGGEFFEHYIMTLLSKHARKCGKTVAEARVTAGSSDGGIDGIMKTVDPLGFKETVMVQAKNRTDLTNETTVRGFYGAICAVGGSRGIFACMSDFHPSARLFLSGIDNCVGLSGEDIFKLACECQYGIRKKDGKYIIDNKIL